MNIYELPGIQVFAYGFIENNIVTYLSHEHEYSRLEYVCYLFSTCSFCNLSNSKQNCLHKYVETFIFPKNDIWIPLTGHSY